MMVLDALGNNLAVGDVVVTTMSSRYAGNIRTGYIVLMGHDSLVIETHGRGPNIRRRPDEVVKQQRKLSRNNWRKDVTASGRRSTATP